jgi:HlyD family secretion protein
MHKRFITVLIVIIVPLTFSLARAEEKIGALGYIRPAGGIIQIQGPSGDIIEKIMVQEEDVVQQGTELIVFSSSNANKAKVTQAESELQRTDKLTAAAILAEQMKLEETRLSNAKAIAIQELKVKKDVQNYGYTKQRLIRLKQLGKESISLQTLEERQYDLQLSKINLNMSRTELERLKENKDMSMALLKQEIRRLILERELNLKRAKIDLEMARIDLANSVIRASITGTILNIYQNEGESTNGQAVISMADLGKMAVVGEIFEADLLKLSLGMRAKVSSKSLPNKLEGKVVKISRILDKISKVSEVTILLEDPEVASRMINLEVDLSIEIEGVR